MKKYHFLTLLMYFQRYIILAVSIKMDPAKIEIIMKNPKSQPTIFQSSELVS